MYFFNYIYFPLVSLPLFKESIEISKQTCNSVALYYIITVLTDFVLCYANLIEQTQIVVKQGFCQCKVAFTSCDRKVKS